MCIYVYICVYMCIYVYICVYMCIYVYICVYMCVYVCIYVYICIYVYMYICIYVYMYICIYVYMYICIYVYMYICIYVYMYICIYVYMYICIYVYMYICIYVYMYICIYVYMYICIHVYMYICIYVYMYICIYVYMYICIYVYMYICIYVYMYICIYVYMCICIYVYMYICIYVYIYIYTCVAVAGDRLTLVGRQEREGSPCGPDSPQEARPWGFGMSYKRQFIFRQSRDFVARRLLEPRSDERWMVRSLERCSMQERGSLEYASLWCTVKPLEILAIPCALGWEFPQQDQHESSQSFSDLVDIFFGTEAVGFFDFNSKIPQFRTSPYRTTRSDGDWNCTRIGGFFHGFFHDLQDISPQTRLKCFVLWPSHKSHIEQLLVPSDFERTIPQILNSSTGDRADGLASFRILSHPVFLHFGGPKCDPYFLSSSLLDVAWTMIASVRKS